MWANMCFTCSLPLMHEKKVQENYSDRQFWPIQRVFYIAPTNTNVFVYKFFIFQHLFFGDIYTYTQLLALLGPWWLSWSSESGLARPPQSLLHTCWPQALYHLHHDRHHNHHLRLDGHHNDYNHYGQHKGRHYSEWWKRMATNMFNRMVTAWAWRVYEDF